MLLLEEKKENSRWGIWKTDESKEELISILDNNSIIRNDLLNIKSESRIKERLAVNVLLKQMTGKVMEISRLESGKPYLENSETNISLSHTKGYVAVALSKTKQVGIDIQYITDKIKRIRSRFVSDSEYIDPENEIIHLLLVWSAKETLYKVFGRGADLRISFITDNFIPNIVGKINITEYITGKKQQFELDYMVTDDFVLTRTIS